MEEYSQSIIPEDQIQEEISMIISDRHVYGDVKKPCPWCNGLTLQEETFAYEKVIFCSHCPYSESKTI